MNSVHCMDGLRQGIQCRVDITPITYLWNPLAKLPEANWKSPHQCKNWDTFFTWANENTFDPFRPGLVMHPKFGKHQPMRNYYNGIDLYIGDPYAGDEDVGRKLGILLKEEKDEKDET